MTHLCDTCRNGLVTHRDNGAKQTWCHASRMSSIPMPNDITRCTSYQDKRFTEKWELEAIAWTLQTDKSGRAIGFVAPDKGKTED